MPTKLPHNPLFYLPYSYHDFTRVFRGATGLPRTGTHCFEVTLSYSPQTKTFSNSGSALIVRGVCGEAEIECYISEPEQKKYFSRLGESDTVVIFGRVTIFKDTFRLQNAGLCPEREQGKVVPLYRAVRGVAKKGEVAAACNDALKNRLCLKKAADEFDRRLGSHSPGSNRIQAALTTAHSPNDVNAAKRALQFLSELNILSVLECGKVSSKTDTKAGLPINDETVAGCINAFPFQLSKSQMAAVEGVAADLRKNVPSDILVSGDVGSGKSVIIFCALALTHIAGGRGALILPNEPLASQMYENFTSFFPSIKTSHIQAGESGKPDSRIDLSDRPILIGTTAVLFYLEKHQDYALETLVIDEEQKLGLEQKLKAVTDKTHQIWSTATCIPNTMGAVLFSDKSIYRIHSHTQKNIKSYVVNSRMRDKAFSAVLRVAEAGHMAAVIYAKVKGDHRQSLEGALEHWQRHGLRGVVLHGKMVAAEKKFALQEIRSGNVDVIITTSIIEIGIDLPDLRLAIVVNAELHGANTLHQMRGRLARKGGEGWFFMYVPGDVTDDALVRLRNVKDTNNGFVLAEKDMEMRGWGDIKNTGTRQHGSTLGILPAIKLTPADFSPYLKRVMLQD